MARFPTISRRHFLGRTLAAGAAAATAGHLLGNTCAAASPWKEGEWQIGCYTRPWDKFDYRVALDAIAEAGYKHAGLMTTKSDTRLVISVKTTPEEARKVGEEVKSRGMQVPSVYGGGIPVNESLEAGIEGMKRLIDNCVAAEAASLLMGGIGNEKLYETYYKAIAETADYAAEKGLVITVKPHGGLNATGPQCRKTVEFVGKKNFRIWYDPGNIYHYSDGQLSPIDDAARVDGLVVGMCVKDFTMSQEDGKLKKDVWVTPGTGMVDFQAVLAKLKQGGFTGGPLVVECFARGEDPKSLISEAKKTREFVEQLVK
ncbi:MAG: sugar phosphate isomerase/epimerase [Rhodopirellula sp.]|nr:sugar phosphate isomerase/epimerase [Rhodopirellula sp.]